jgi:hypothetical protein
MALLDHFGDRSHVRKSYRIELRFDKETDALIGGDLHFTLCDSNGEFSLRKSIPLADLPTVTGANKTYLEGVAQGITDDMMTQANKLLFIPTPQEPPE